ncbi:hypothetical protein ACFFNX_40795, partial [Actinoallomurus acaciae]
PATDAPLWDQAPTDAPPPAPHWDRRRPADSWDPAPNETAWDRPRPQTPPPGHDERPPAEPSWDRPETPSWDRLSPAESSWDGLPPAERSWDRSPAGSTPSAESWNQPPADSSSPAESWDRPPADSSSTGSWDRPPAETSSPTGFSDRPPGEPEAQDTPPAPEPPPPATPFEPFEPPPRDPAETNGHRTSAYQDSRVADAAEPDPLSDDSPFDSSSDVGTPLADESWESIRRGFDRLKDMTNWESVGKSDLDDIGGEPAQDAFDETAALPAVDPDEDDKRPSS